MSTIPFGNMAYQKGQEVVTVTTVTDSGVTQRELSLQTAAVQILNQIINWKPDRTPSRDTWRIMLDAILDEIQNRDSL